MLFTDYNDENEPLVANGGGNQLLIDDKSAFDLPAEEDVGATKAGTARPPLEEVPHADSLLSSDEDEPECDPNGDVALCDACNRFVPLSSYDKHVSYFCKRQMGECPYCFEKYPVAHMDEHIGFCRVTMQDPDLVTCKFCKVQMRKSELKDHAIAHTIQQKQVERQHITRVAEIEAFFEEEKLETEGSRNAPVLDPLELLDMPVTKFEVTERHDDADVFFKCIICQCDFEDQEEIRTTRCLHMFHKGCIDQWLTKTKGSCPVCKAI